MRGREERARYRSLGIAALAGLVLGVGWFYLSSSRGLDQIELSLLVVSLFEVVMVGLVIAGVARIVWFNDRLLLPATVLLFVGVLAGSMNALRVIPGSTTDGEAILSPGGDASPRPTDPLTGKPARSTVLVRVRCEWSAKDGAVTRIESRRPISEVGRPQGAWLMLDPHAATAAFRSELAWDPPRPVDVQLTGADATSGAEGVALLGREHVIEGALAWACPRLP